MNFYPFLKKTFVREVKDRNSTVLPTCRKQNSPPFLAAGCYINQKILFFPHLFYKTHLRCRDNAAAIKRFYPDEVHALRQVADVELNGFIQAFLSFPYHGSIRLT